MSYNKGFESSIIKFIQIDRNIKTYSKLTPLPKRIISFSIILGFDGQNIEITFNWNPIEKVNGYELQVATLSDFSSEMVISKIISAPISKYITNTLSYYTNYYWRVRAITAGGNGRWSNVQNFQTKGPPEQIPVAIQATEILGNSFRANWNTLIGAINYRLDVATDEQFNNFITGFNNLSVGNVTSKQVTNLLEKTSYYYRVRAENQIGVSQNSNIISCITEECFGIYMESEIDTMILDGYIPIASKYELDQLRNATEQTFSVGTPFEGAYTSGLDKKYVQVKDIKFEDSDFEDGGDFYNDGSGWLPIGDGQNGYANIYDGSGLLIKNLRINRENSGYIGLFGYIAGATINHLGIISGSISGQGVVGGLVGYSLNSQIEKCFYTGVVSGSSETGGLVGSQNNSDIVDCYSIADVIGIWEDIGGLVGIQTGGSTVMRCYAVGNVIGSTNVGGLVGYEDELSNVTNSYYNSETSGQSDTGKGEPRTTEQMTYPYSIDPTVYVDWDFIDIWGNDTESIINNGYPYLLNITI